MKGSFNLYHLLNSTNKGNNSYWLSEKTKPKVGYHFRIILKLKVEHFEKIVAEVQ